MATTTNINRESWDSLTSTLEHLEVSFSRDSCYGSDEVSISSNNTAPLQSGVLTNVVKHEEPSLQPFLKSNLKNSCTVLQDDSESESGYGSDEMEDDFDALEEGEDDEDDMSDFSIWENTSQDVPESREDHTDLFDDSFIGFDSMVRFDDQVCYIDSPEFSDDEEMSESQMTCHEQFLLHMMQSSQSSPSDSQMHEESDEESESDHKEFIRTASHQPEDFPREAVNEDREIFVAEMNCIHGIADNNYKHYLRTQVDNIRHGHEAESMHPDDPSCMYLDQILDHVIGVFRNLLAADELNELVALREAEKGLIPEEGTIATSIPALSHHHALLDKIERFLLDRLAKGRVEVRPDELSFFAGGIAHALGTKDLPAV
ncbi:uncharacterized protein N7477_009950 [Penicillium maclennaniae]|uniref:uncharacterized protein n=1 Tax=Penicillium maclennaniae TaxID=1343394 RepID=UPI002541D73E|nr:uncharacterized protein N7477_009950 [Penicillium maclennaniae]KAJ5662334.1 hypothetical protein N7477_009950 [Penicillium maclennaniae]